MTEQIEKITNEWQNKIKQITDERTIKQDTYIKSEQADDGTRRQIRQTGRTKGTLEQQIIKQTSNCMIRTKKKV